MFIRTHTVCGISDKEPRLYLKTTHFETYMLKLYRKYLLFLILNSLLCQNCIMSLWKWASGQCLLCKCEVCSLGLPNPCKYVTFHF